MLQILNSQSYKIPTCESCEYHISQSWKFLLDSINTAPLEATNMSKYDDFPLSDQGYSVDSFAFLHFFFFSFTR